MIITPSASELVETRAIAESPLIFLLFLNPISKNAARITIGILTKSGGNSNTDAIAIAPKPTCDKPSPIIEYLFKTRITPSKEHESVIRLPAIIAFIIKEYENISSIF